MPVKKNTKAKTKTSDLSQSEDMIHQANDTVPEIKESVPQAALQKEETFESKSEDVFQVTEDTQAPLQANQKNNESFSITDSDDSGTKNNIKLIFKVIILLAVFVLGMLAGGFIVYQKGVPFLKNTVLKQANQNPTPTPTPTEIPVDLSKYTIEVLNGSEINGAATQLKDALSKEGFSVLSTGNATDSSFIKTAIRAKKDVSKQYLRKLKDFLLKSHALSETQDLENSEKTDVIVIIGAK